MIPRHKINKAGELIMKIEPAREQVSRAEKSACAQRPPSRVGAGRLVPDGSGWPRVWSAGRARPATDARTMRPPVGSSAHEGPGHVDHGRSPSRARSRCADNAHYVN